VCNAGRGRRVHNITLSGVASLCGQGTTLLGVNGVSIGASLRCAIVDGTVGVSSLMAMRVLAGIRTERDGSYALTL